MSTPDQPDTPPLTRKQLREIRNTGATPIIVTDDTPPAADVVPAVEAPPTPAAPRARAAEPVVLPEPPGPDFAVDLGVSPLTRRQARQQERIRTASVPVITPEVAAAYIAGQSQPDTDAAASPFAPPPFASELSPFEALGVATVVATESESRTDEVGDEEPEVGHAEPEVEVLEVAEPDVEHVEEEPAVFAEVDTDDTYVQDEHAEDVSPATDEADGRDLDTEAAEGSSDEDVEPATSEEPGERAVVNPGFGAALLAGDAAHSDVAPSFDDLITRSSNGSAATPNALIVTQAHDTGPMMAQLTTTGDVVITGTLNLPEGLGSMGHAPGVADGKEVDAVLVDSELPAHSSPTPIAASAAISTVKTPGEIIKPPTPEKGGKLMLTLAITAGALALALVGVLILAFATGVF